MSRRSGAIRRPDSRGKSLDNVGVQYGLQALNRGVITKAEFIDLNEKIGGFDRDGHVRQARTVADPEGIRMVYAAGRLNAMHGLSALPILQIRKYLDASGNIHSRERDFAVRERLRKSAGRVDNRCLAFSERPRPRARRQLCQRRDERDWSRPRHNEPVARALARDTSAAPMPEKVRRAKPAAATDACWDLNLKKIVEPATLDGPGRCNQLYPPHLTPRLAAGAPIADDVLKCQLKAIDPKDYRVTLTPEETERLRRVFPGGVCDYAKPGIISSRPRGRICGCR